MDSSDVIHVRGNDLRPSRGIITRKIGQAMVEITDLTDATVHRRHIDQIHFNETPTSTKDLAEGNPQNLPCDTPPKITEDHTQQPATPGTSTDENTALAFRRPVRRASQFDEALLREESCGDSDLRDHACPGAARYSFRTLVVNRP
ncbi:unnamed protein product [Echinostoma caproni]|uniref:DUF5641 domain-containing protein n=1 Tax=Echinostoma caproni TaxID=27848 RepID=A0A183BFJ6_9TREM|nr:unnamed protein product [Echinostoma caproni]